MSLFNLGLIEWKRVNLGNLKTNKNTHLLAILFYSNKDPFIREIS